MLNFNSAFTPISRDKPGNQQPHRTAQRGKDRKALSSKRCGNCRTRKTACDRAQPSCTNCQRRGVECLGYGLQLSWPRGDDGRRAAEGHQHHILPLRSKALEFVNATDRDIEAWAGNPRRRYLEEGKEKGFGPSVPRFLGSVTLGQIDPFLATNQYSPVARLISSALDEVPELYTLLVRMSLADETPSALAARHAIAALSYQHLGQREAAVLHQTKALGALQAVINSLSSGNTENMQAFRAMAASMLLNIFETLNFDASSLSWAIFFCGCKKIVNLVHTPHTSYEGDSAMILDWIFYHDTLYKFSVRHWYPKQRQQILLAQQRKVVSKAVFSPLRQIILPSTGCSLELLDLICQTVDAVLERDDPGHLSPSHLQTIRRLELRLEALTQTPRITTVTSSNTDEPTKTQTQTDPSATTETPPTTTPTHQQEIHLAELYRLATHIYLLRMARALPPTDPRIAALTTHALTLLKHPSIQHDGCARPWPLFIIALEVGASSQHGTEGEEGREDARSVVSGALEAARRRRPLGNFVLVRRFVHAAWVQTDLGGVEDDAKKVYDVVVSGVRVPPSFT